MATMPEMSAAVRALHAHRAALKDLAKAATKLSRSFGLRGSEPDLEAFTAAGLHVSATRQNYDAAIRARIA